MGYSSDSESDRDSRRQKKRHHLSSRDGSSDRERSRRSKKTKHRRSRSRSHSSGRHQSSEHSHRRHGRHNSRSRSRSHSRTVSPDHSSRSKSSKSGRKSESRSRESSKVKDTKRVKKESPERYKTESSSPRRDIVTNAQQSELLLQKALQAAVVADDVLRAQGVVLDISGVHVKTEATSFDEQQRRASAINDIENLDFVQSTFKSSRSEIPLPSGSIVDASHSGAMFGSVNATAPVIGAVSRNDTSATTNNAHDNDPLMHPSLFVSAAEKMERWKQKLALLRKRT